jgi:methyl-accepting chemotaxis protein
MSKLIKLTIAQRIGLGIGCLGATVLVAMSGLIGDAMEAQAARQQAVSMALTRSLTKQIGDAFSVRDGKLKLGEKIINGDQALVDEIHQITGGVATIFMGDVRVATNVLKPDGTQRIAARIEPSKQVA